MSRNSRRGRAVAGVLLAVGVAVGAGWASRPAVELEAAGAVYVWSPVMPLSERGIAEVRRAAGELGIELEVVEAAELGRADLGLDAAEMVAAGATLHYPSLLVHREGKALGHAILGYKSAAAYRALIEARLRTGGGSRPASRAEPADGPPRTVEPSPAPLAWIRDYPLPGRPGAYFRSVAGRQALAFELTGIVRLLDLEDGEIEVAPGQVDFVPTPDGRLFVTPHRMPGGLAFYDAEEVFQAVAADRGRAVEPIYVDPRMRDQYPSVGILRQERDGRGTRTLYRVLTSWYDGIAYRDYAVRFAADGRPVDVTPTGDQTTACPHVSIPILSPDGREVAGRDETGATTRIFALGDDGECRQVEDLGLQTGKVAWRPDGRRVAFAIPRGVVHDGSGSLWVGPDQPALAGIFVYDRDTRRATLVADSEAADRLTFPEFVGMDSLTFIVGPTPDRRGSAFRLVCCI